MRTILEMTREDAQANIPYAIVCEAREGKSWNTTRRRRRWIEDFSDDERKAAIDLFRKAKLWYLGQGVPDVVRMTPSTYALWLKLGDFCAMVA